VPETYDLIVGYQRSARRVPRAIARSGSGGPADAAATLSVLHGYYDQAHAARDFKRYTGVSARSFLAVQNGIAALMHGRSVQDDGGADG
jgi:AraC-like DNA-binding protein